MKSKSNFLKKLLGIVGCMIMAVAFNAAAGATCAVAIGCAPETGAIAGNVLALALGQAAPAGSFRAGVTIKDHRKWKTVENQTFSTVFIFAQTAKIGISEHSAV